MPLKWMELEGMCRSRGHRKHGYEDQLANQSVHFQFNSSIVHANVFGPKHIHLGKLNTTVLQIFLVYTRLIVPQYTTICHTYLCLQVYSKYYHYVYYLTNYYWSSDKSKTMLAKKPSDLRDGWPRMYFAIRAIFLPGTCFWHKITPH